MTQMIGMDPEAVEALALRLSSQADVLSGTIGGVDRLVHVIGAQWQGQDGTAFLEAWQRAHRPALTAVQRAIAGLAESARRNVRQQVEASATAGGSGGGGRGPIGVWSAQGGTTPQAVAARKAIDAAARGRSAAWVKTWWKDLPRTQRARFLTFAPGVLMTLPGLAPYMRLYRTTGVSDASEQGKATLTENLLFAKAKEGADEQLVLKRFPDGSATVLLGAGIFAGLAKGAGADGQEASVGATAATGGTVTYRFSTAASARSFYDKILGGSNGDPVTIAKNAESAIREGDLTPVSETVSEKVSATASITGGEGAVQGSAAMSASATASYDTRTGLTTTTFAVSGREAAGASFGGVQATGDAEIAMVSQGDQLRSVILSGQGTMTDTSGSSTSGVEGTYEMKIPYNDATRQDLHALLASAEGGHLDESALQKLAASSEITKQVDVVHAADHHFDHSIGIGQLEGSLETGSSRASSTWLKPVGESESLPFP